MGMISLSLNLLYYLLTCALTVGDHHDQLEPFRPNKAHYFEEKLYICGTNQVFGVVPKDLAQV